MTIDRRHFVAVTAGALFAGCAGTSDEESDESPKYPEDADFDLPAAELDSVDSSVYATEDENENYLFEYAAEDDTVVILADYSIRESQDEAVESVNTAKERMTSVNETSLENADHAFWSNEQQMSYCLARDGNLTAETAVARMQGFEVTPDQNRAIQYLDTALGYWGDEYADG